MVLIFLDGLSEFEKGTGFSSIMNAFVLAKAQSWGISLVFVSRTCLFALSYEEGEGSTGMKGKGIWSRSFCCSRSSDLCIP